MLLYTDSSGNGGTAFAFRFKWCWTTNSSPRRFCSCLTTTASRTWLVFSTYNPAIWPYGPKAKAGRRLECSSVSLTYGTSCLATAQAGRSRSKSRCTAPPRKVKHSAPQHCPLPRRLRWPLRPRRDWSREDFVNTLLIHIDHLPTPVHTFKLLTNDRNPP
jgi:hypothetical protein